MPSSIDVVSAPRSRHSVDQTSWLAFVVTVLTTGGAVLAVGARGLPSWLLLAFPLALATFWILRSPILGLYVLFAAALLIPVQPLGFSDSLTDGIPFFLNLSDPASVNLNGLGVTPAEILMTLVALGVIGSAAARHEALPAGRLLAPYVLFGIAIVMGELNGLIHGGDFKLSLWELRPQVYGLVVFILASQLVRDRSQVKVILAILLAAEAFKGAVGVFRYFVTLSRQLGGLEAIQAHEESYLLGLFLVAVVIGLIWFRKPLMLLLVGAAPIVFTAIVVNHRRAGIGALAIEIATVFVLAYLLEPRLRRQLTVVGVVSTLIGIGAVITYWNQEYGAIAEMIRPVKSLIDPSARDLSSDLYRIAEASNLKATFSSSPLLGIGFGHPYYIFAAQTGVSQIDPLWNIIPHNTLLWVPMRMGIIGLVTFWGLACMAIVEAIWVVRNVSDPLIRSVGIFGLAAFLGLLFTAYVDIGLENYRTMIVTGLLLALISRAPYLASSDRSGRHLPAASP